MNMQIRCLHFKELETQELPLFLWAISGLQDTSTTFLNALMPPAWQQILFKWQLPQTVFERSSTQPEACGHTRRLHIALTTGKIRYVNTLFHAIAI